ncbi:MAG: carboxymuconolactone decarboxylase family protein [Actinomycetota bacterium]
MAWIKTVNEPDADAVLKAIYAEQRRQAGDLANILKIHSLAPDVLQVHLAVYRAAMHAPGELSRKHREMIAVAVSTANRCQY